jgi:hypothetical protein
MIICFAASCICFNNIKTDEFVRLYDAARESGQILTAGYSISNVDVCTVEMLGNTHTSSLSVQQNALRSNEVQRRLETQSVLLCNLYSCQSPLNSFTSADSNINMENADVAEIMRFIHEKDGKKKI